LGNIKIKARAALRSIEQTALLIRYQWVRDKIPDAVLFIGIGVWFSGVMTMRLDSRCVKYVLLTSVVALGLGGCVAYPAPYYGDAGYYAAPPVAVAPAPYYAAPAYGGVYIGGGRGWHHRRW
jgi:hypothetical protein